VTARTVRAGRPLQEAEAAVVMVHGRGATAESILTLAEEVGQPDLANHLAYIAPQAPGLTWYPYSFLAPFEQNEPHLSSALRTLEEVLAELAAAGIPPERTVLLGFSQGACLSLEFAARHAQPYAGVVALSGGLIGPPGTPREYEGTFNGTPVFLGCSDRDPHVPAERVHESAEVFRRMEARVTERIYPGLGHTVNQDELSWVADLLGSLARQPV
jgi:phospholipase/carboxylesterase